MHQRSNNIKSISLTGKIFPFKDGQPVGVVVENVTFLSLFSTEEKLHFSMEMMGVSDYSIKQIDDHTEFLDSIQGSGIRVMLDPYLAIHETEGPVTRFTEIKY